MKKHKKKSPLKATQLHRRRRQLFFLKMLGAISALVLSITGLGWLSEAKALTINTIVVEGDAGIDSTDVTNLIEKDIAGHYLWIFAKRNRALYPHEVITKDLMAAFPRVERTELHMKGDTLHVLITERTPKYTWCQGLPTQNVKNECYFLDEHGYVFSEAPTFSGNAYIAFYGLLMRPNPIGQTYLNKDIFTTINQVIQFLNNKDIHPYALLATANGVFELYLNRGTKLVLKDDQEASSIISNLAVVIDETVLLTKSNISKLEYIDIRFGNKLYYKLKGDNPLQISN
jgi:cell division septal protein FtsQ